ncbi:unnamed protein product [Somion occarium]|uniref:F-box domain-containing protein n=1 Tax=Somion occarium TaxID=3059160 RepID=A0ABP1CVD0_9APHY
MIPLPQELLDQILDQLYDDMRTLGSCALTSRSLLDRSRHHHFRMIVVITEPPSHKRWSEFLELIVHPDFSKHIRSLELLFFDWNYSVDGCLAISLLDFQRLLDRLPFLQDLDMQGVNITASGCTSPNDITENRLHNLDLRQCFFNEMSTTLPGLLHLSSPHSLSLSNLHSVETEPHALVVHHAVTPGIASPVAHLRLGRISAKCLKILRLAISSQTLVKFTFGIDISGDEISSLGDLINHISPSLRELRLTLPINSLEHAKWFNRRHIPWHLIHLSSTRQLTSLVLDFDVWGIFEQEWEMPTQVILALLLTLPLTLRQIRIEITCNLTNSLSFLKQAALKECLHRFPDLDSVVFGWKLCGYTKDECIQLATRVKTLFPDLEARGFFHHEF